MGVEDEFGIDHKKAAAIVDHFREADNMAQENIGAFHGPLESYINTFGPINFAALEMIFRENNFNTHLIAIPASFIEIQTPDVIVADPNDLRLHDIVTPLPFVIGFSSSKEKAEATALGCGFVYDADVNLKNLRRTGVCVPRENVGVVKPVFDIRKLGLHVKPFKGQPQGDRRMAKWN